MMDRINGVFARHLWLQFAVAWVAATGVVLLFSPGSSPLGVLVRVVACSAGAVWMTVRRRHREEKAAGGGTDLVVLNRMLRRGETPSDPQQRRAMGELVDQRLGRTRHRTAALVGMAVLLAAVVTAVAFTAGMWRTIGYGAYGVAFFGYLFFAGRIGVRRLHRMHRALASEGGTAAGAADHHVSVPSADREDDARHHAV